LVNGQEVSWTGLTVAPGKTQTLKLAVAISSCAANTVFVNATITGPNDCVVMTPQVQTTLKRSPKDKPCAPTERAKGGWGGVTQAHGVVVSLSW
jgi:hypothetical protein